MKPKHTYHIYLLFIFLLGLVACSSSKHLRKGPIPSRSTMDLLNAIESHNFEFDWFSAKAKIKFESPEESAKAVVNIRMKKDSIIWMNVKKLSVEVSRLMITPDSIFIIYRLDQMFERSSYADMAGFYGLNVGFSELQNLILGNCIIPREKFSYSHTDSVYYFIHARDENLQLRYILNPYSLLLEKFIIQDDLTGEVQILFNEYKHVNDSLNFSHSREYLAYSDDENARAEVDLSSVEINVPKRIIFAIPDHYGEYR